MDDDEEEEFLERLREVVTASKDREDVADADYVLGRLVDTIIRRGQRDAEAVERLLPDCRELVARDPRYMRGWANAKRESPRPTDRLVLVALDRALAEAGEGR